MREPNEVKSTRRWAAASSSSVWRETAGGRSGGYRTIIAFRTETRSIFLYGFAKNERQNIGTDELDLLKKLARRFLAMTDAEIGKAIVEGELIEVGHDGEDETQVS